MDDALDYMGDPEELGKNVGDDLAEGKPTLPLIYLMKHGTPEERAQVRHAIETADTGMLDDIIRLIRTRGALDYTLQQARAEAEKAQAALEPLPASPYRTALAALAELAVNRRA